MRSGYLLLQVTEGQEFRANVGKCAQVLSSRPHLLPRQMRILFILWKALQLIILLMLPKMEYIRKRCRVDGGYPADAAEKEKRGTEWRNFDHFLS